MYSYIFLLIISWIRFIILVKTKTLRIIYLSRVLSGLIKGRYKFYCRSKCKYCNSDFYSVEDCYFHVQKMHSAIHNTQAEFCTYVCVYQCLSCTQSFNNEKEIVSHCKNKHNFNF